MKAISLNQIAKEEIKGTGYEIRVNGQKVVSESISFRTEQSRRTN